MVIFALLSAVFAALTSILPRSASRASAPIWPQPSAPLWVLVMAWGIVLLTGEIGGVRNISGRSWLFLGLSGVATGLSWLCYYHALQLGQASKVVPVDKFSVVISLVLAFLILHETVDAKTILGAALITAGPW